MFHAKRWHSSTVHTGRARPMSHGSRDDRRPWHRRILAQALREALGVEDPNAFTSPATATDEEGIGSAA